MKKQRVTPEEDDECSRQLTSEEDDDSSREFTLARVEKEAYNSTKAHRAKDDDDSFGVGKQRKETRENGRLKEA